MDIQYSTRELSVTIERVSYDHLGGIGDVKQ